MRANAMAILILVVVASLATACSAPSTTSRTGTLNVVAAESPWGAVAQAVGGRFVSVTSLVASPNTDPHEYQPDAAAAAAVATAGVVIDNGVGYDTFMAQLLSTGGAANRQVVTAARVLGVNGTDANPHLWYAIERVPEVAHAIEQSLAHAAPAHAADFARQLTTFDRSLTPITRVIRDIRAQRPGAPVAQTERVAGYLLDEAGLRIASPLAFALAVESGQNPSAEATQQMDQLLARREADALVYNVQTTSPVTNDVRSSATKSGISVVPVSEVVLPVGDTFVAWQLRQVDELAAALKVAS